MEARSGSLLSAHLRLAACCWKRGFPSVPSQTPHTSGHHELKHLGFHGGQSPISNGVLEPTQHHPGRACWEFLRRLISHCQRAFPSYLVDITCSYISSIMPRQTQLINSSLLPTMTLFNAGPVFCLTPVSMLQRQPGNKVFIPCPIPALDT